MATKKKLKYEENKKILQITKVEEYNDIGIDTDEVAAKGTGVYKTRKLDAHIKDTTQPLRIDQAKPVTKKKIAVPETKNDDNYYTLIDFKRAQVDTVNQNRGYKRAFLDDHLPNAELYSCNEEDLKMLAELNADLSRNSPGHPHPVKDEDFQTAIQIWESEIGRAVTLEKKKNGAAAPETNRLSIDRAKHLLKEHKDKETGAGLGLVKHVQFNRIVEFVYQYWDSKRAERNHPFLRKYWSNYIRPDHKLQRKAFHEPRKEARMKTRNSEEKLTDRGIQDKFNKLKKEIELAAHLSDLVTKREVLKNSKLELGIKAFYLQNNLPLAEAPRFGSDFSEADLRPKVLVQTKKLCEQVNGIIRNIAPNEEKTALVQNRHSNELQFPVPPVQASVPHPKPVKTKPENLEDELTPVICTLIADLNGQSFPLKEWVFGPNFDQLMIPRFKKANKAKLDTEQNPQNAIRRDEASNINRARGLPSKNILQMKLVRRYGLAGHSWIERKILSDNCPVSDIEDSKELANQLTLQSSSPEDRVGQMRLQRYQEMEDLLCFEDRDTDFEGLSFGYSNGYKSFLKQRRPT